MSKLEIRSPLPGTFYRSPSPGSPPFKADGDTVHASDAIGLVETMKIFQEVYAGVEGTAIRFLIENEDPVMAGQVIAQVDQ
jgi:acetyl-CoA carboxylase biotin carboxyl carrier protein